MEDMQSMQQPAMPSPPGGENPQMPMQSGMPEEEKSRWWLWVLVAGVIVLAGLATYFIFFK